MAESVPEIEVKSSERSIDTASAIRRGFEIDYRLVTAVVFSACLHGLLIYCGSFLEFREEGEMSESIQRIPERIARLIMDKPIEKEPKKTVTKLKKETLKEKIAKEKNPEIKKQLKEKQKQARKKEAKKSIAQRAKRVQQKLRSTGVLAMLTGRGPTKSRFQSTPDILKGTRGRFGDLDSKLKGTRNLVRAGNEDYARIKLGSRDIGGVENAPNVKDLIKDIKVTETLSLTKLGKFNIAKPSRLEGAAVQSAQRDPAVLKKVLDKKSISIRGTYRRMLKRNPGLEGKITFRFTILASGRVEDIEILENTTGSEEFAQELLRKIKRWRFPKIPEDQGTMRASWPFVFQS